MPVDQLTDQVRQRVTYAGAFGGRIKLDLNGEGTILLDGASAPPQVSNDDADSDATVKMSMDTLRGLLDGTQDPTLAFMTGKIKVDGSMGYAMKLASLLEE
ncbi:MAG: SCP2 sterol-binding domain-containing protein [Alphaproteobacteria bacterium]|nr:SCP2 sterol-binding domain-containing protein [Alphaproteobacteria bacterium SS10]